MIYGIDFNNPTFKISLLIIGVIFLIAVFIVVFVVIYLKTYKKVLIRKNAQIGQYEQMINDLFAKRVEMLAAFNKKYKKLETPNAFSDISEKVAFKKETDKYIRLTGSESVLMENSVELSQYVNQYNRAVTQYNKLLKNIFIKPFARTNGFVPKELFDESEPYNVVAE